MSNQPSRQPKPAPTPAPPPNPDDLPHALTFFVTRRDRKRIIAALRQIHNDRAIALLTALGLHDGGAT